MMKSTSPIYINVKGQLLDLSIPQVMGILNVTPDSFSYLRIAISDTGMGLADSELEGIFEPYTQLDKSHKKTFLRSLTLGTAYTMLKRMGGALWVNSEVMKGSTFFIIIPVEKEIKTQE